MADRDVDDGLSRFLKQATARKLLTPKEEYTLGMRAKRGDERARHELLEANMRLVIRTARFYRNRGVPFGDLIQEGVIGLDRATRKFDAERGFRFSTYAVPWIQQAVRRAISGSGTTIRLPPQVADRRAKAKAAIENDPDISLPELAALMEITVDQLERALGAADVATSLNRELGGGGSDEDAHTLMDSLADPFAPDPGLDIPEHTGALHEALGGLTRVQRDVVWLRFGLGTEEPLPLAEVARRTGLSTSVCQTVQKDALRELKGLLDFEPQD